MNKLGTMRFLTRWAGWAAVAFVTFATLAPIHERPVLTDVNVEHFGAYGVIGFLLMSAYPRHRLPILIFLVGVASLLEFGQLFVPSRHARVLDAAEKIVGGAFGVAAAVFIEQWLLSRRRQAARE